MNVHATLRQLRISPRKVRLVSGVIKGLDVAAARYQLNALVKKSSTPMLKLLNSALANAKNNFNLEESNLFVKDVIVDEGVKLKRGLPKGFGRISPIQKKTSHIKIVLEEKVPGVQGATESTQESTATTAKKETKIRKAKTFDAKKSSVKESKSVSTPVKSTTKKIFQRKAI